MKYEIKVTNYQTTKALTVTIDEAHTFQTFCRDLSPENYGKALPIINKLSSLINNYKHSYLVIGE